MQKSDILVNAAVKIIRQRPKHSSSYGREIPFHWK